MQNKKSYSLLNKLIVRTSLISLILLVISGIVISLGFRNDISEDIQEGTKDMIIDMILSESFEHVYWVFALCLILLIILIYFTVKNSLKDVNTVSNFVKDIDINKEIRFPNLKTPKEINPLIESLKSSFKKIKNDMKQQREFIDNAAHELNTPIAICFKNLFDNAIHNKKQGTQIKVFIDSISGVSVINEHTIQDVNKDTVKNIFEKFWRGDKNKYSGSGLGLAIVKRIVEAHKATIVPQIDQKTFKIIIKFNLN